MAYTDRDIYGGWTDLPAPGIQANIIGQRDYFHLEKINNRWVFVTPAQNQFFYSGVQIMDSDLAHEIGDTFRKYKYPAPDTKGKWAEDIATQLKTYGINAIGYRCAP